MRRCASRSKRPPIAPPHCRHPPIRHCLIQTSMLRSRPMTKLFPQLVQRAFSISVCLGLMLALGTSRAHADLQIMITKGVTDPLPIAIGPFAHALPPDGTFDVAAVVQHDLESSGRFRAMPRKQMQQTPIRAADVQAADWKASGNDYVAVGRVSMPSSTE